MENASEALMIAGSILLLIIALSVNISSFTNLRSQAYEFFSEKTKLEYQTDDEGYINFLTSDADKEENRKVGVETVISSINRVSKENFDVYINLKFPINEADFPKEIIKENKNNKYILKFTIRDNIMQKEVTKEVTGKIYELIKNKSFTETLGLFKEKVEEGVLEGERITYRIINFTEI